MRIKALAMPAVYLCIQPIVRFLSAYRQLGVKHSPIAYCEPEPTTEESPMKFKALGLAGIAIAMYTIPAFAHHSFAMFDADKKMTLEGTIKEFQWTNPHSWILMTVNNEQWAIELGAPGGLARQGWVPKTLTPGMKVTAGIHPLKDGTHSGQYMAVTLPDGTTKGNPNGAANANAGAN